MADWSNLASGVGDELKQLVAQRLFEQMQRARLEDLRAQRGLQARGQDIQARGQDLSHGDAAARIGLDTRQQNFTEQSYAEGAPSREAGRLHTVASTDALTRAPLEAEKGRLFTAGEADKGRTFTGGQGDLNRANALKVTGMQGANALAVANVRHPDPTQPTQQQQNEVADSIALIDQINQDPSLAHAVGPVDQYAGGVINADPTGVNRFRALHNQLVGKLSLAQAGKLKGQGQISDKERAMLAAAATALSQGLSEADYKKELVKVRGQFVRMAGQGSGGPAPDAAVTVNTDPLGLFGKGSK